MKLLVHSMETSTLSSFRAALPCRWVNISQKAPLGDCSGPILFGHSIYTSYQAEHYVQTKIFIKLDNISCFFIRRTSHLSDLNGNINPNTPVRYRARINCISNHNLRTVVLFQITCSLFIFPVKAGRKVKKRQQQIHYFFSSATSLFLAWPR